MNRSAAIILLCAAFGAGAYDAPGMRDAMASVFASMRVLLELSATPEDLAAPANQNAMLAAAQELADQASIVSEHAPRDEVSFLAGSLDRYAVWIRRSLEWGRTDITQRLVHDAVDVCIACHTRLPAGKDSPLAEQFLESKRMAALPLRERAKLAIATRRFDDGLVAMENLLSRHVTAAVFDELVRDYLVVTVRVKRDPARALRTLQALAPREDVDPERRARLGTWVGALQRIELSPPLEGDLATARALVRGAEARRDAAMGDPLVDYVAASRVLYEFLESGSGSVDEGAEAYYLLGLTQYRIAKDAWLPQAELFLEKAIRTAPASDHARRALVLLRDRIEHSFAAEKDGVPDDVQMHLRMLEELVTGG